METVTCLSLEYDLDILPHFLRHYGRGEVAIMNFILQSRHDDRQRFDQVEQLIRDELKGRTGRLDHWQGEFADKEKTRRMNALRNPDVWTMFPDSDEFYDFEHDPAELLDLQAVTDPDFPASVIFGYLSDRLASRARVPAEVRPSPAIDKQFPYELPMRCTSPGIEHKVCALKGSYRFTNPHVSFIGPDTYRREGGEFAKINHYRWTTQRIAKLKERLQWSLPNHRLYKETQEEIKQFTME